VGEMVSNVMKGCAMLLLSIMLAVVLGSGVVLAFSVVGLGRAPTDHPRRRHTGM
jgi:uncharacterized protein (DUF58 family)